MSKEQQSVKITMFRLKFPLFKKSFFTFRRIEFIYHLLFFILSIVNVFCVFCCLHAVFLLRVGENRALFMTMRNWLKFFPFHLWTLNILFTPTVFAASFSCFKSLINFINFPVWAFVLIRWKRNITNLILNGQKYGHSSNNRNNDKLNYGVITWKMELFGHDLQKIQQFFILPFWKQSACFYYRYCYSLYCLFKINENMLMCVKQRFRSQK